MQWWRQHGFDGFGRTHQFLEEGSRTHQFAKEGAEIKYFEKFTAQKNRGRAHFGLTNSPKLANINTAS